MPPTQTIPTLDLREFQGDAIAQQDFVQMLGQALTEMGFFAVVNHGVERDLIQRAYQVAEQFFTLPEAIKSQYAIPALHGQRGFTAFGREHAKDHPVPDLKEFWHVGRDLPGDHPQRSLYPPNVEIAEVPDFQPVMSQLYTQLEACVTTLLQACARFLGEPETLIADMIQDSDTILRIIHYPPVPNDVDVASLRSAPHEDINLITLLCEATDDGLELLQRDGTWLPIPALPGQIIVDSGDMLQQLTNGRLKSTTHRVTNPTGDNRRRFSMPFFVHARKEVDLSPLPSCVAPGEPPRYAPITAGDYLMQRLREIGLA